MSIKLKNKDESEKSFYAQLRLFIDVHACNTVSNSAPQDDYLGFFAQKDDACSIFINRDINFVRRKIFTLSHEFAHLIYDKQGISNPFLAKNDFERMCNRYSAGFIAPDDEVLKIVTENGTTHRSSSSLIDVVSAKTYLSRQAAALRLAELECISEKDARQFFRRITKVQDQAEFESPQSGTPMGRGAAIGKKLSEVGVFNAYVASLALKEHLVDKYDIQNGLGISDTLQTSVLDLAARRFEAGAE